VHELRADEVDPLAARLHLALAGGEHVAHPLALGAVGQRDDVAPVGAKQVHRRPVRTAGAPAYVRDYREAREPARNTARDRVGHHEIEPRQGPGERHRDKLAETDAAGPPACRRTTRGSWLAGA